MHSDILKDYEFTEESINQGTEVELSKGLKAVIRPYGAPEYWKAYLSHLGDLSALNVEDDETVIKDSEATAHALAEWVVVSLGEGDKLIDDPKDIFEVLQNPVYFKLRQELVELAKRDATFLAEREDSIKKQ